MKLNRTDIFRLLPFTAIAILLTMTAIMESCNDIGCTDLRSSMPLAGFYSSSTDSKISVDSILLGGIGAPNDSLLVDSGAITSSLYLPFRSENTSTSYFIKDISVALDYPQLTDTVTFNYTSTPYFVSADCGAMYVYEVKSVIHTRHLIDSIAITDSVINNIDMERIKFYFRTSEPDDQ